MGLGQRSQLFIVDPSVRFAEGLISPEQAQLVNDQVVQTFSRQRVERSRGFISARTSSAQPALKYKMAKRKNRAEARRERKKREINLSPV
jgi:hypothetical protein